MSSQRKAGIPLPLVLLAIVSVSLVVTAVLYSGLLLSVAPSPPSPTTTTTAQGLAYCAVTGTVAPATSPPRGCSNVGSKLQIHLFDLYAGSSLSGYSCRFWELKGGAWSFRESVTNTGSNGLCTSVGEYLPGTAVTIQACESILACAATDYAQQKTFYFAALPASNAQGLGAGTVPFATFAPSIVPTINFEFPIVKLTGDAFATNTPNDIDFNLENATLVTGTSGTLFVNGGGNLNDIFTITFILKVGATGTEPSDPYGAGYKSFLPVDLQSGAVPLGTLVGGVHLVVTATTGTDMVVPTDWSQIYSNSPTKQTYFYHLSDEQQTRATDPGGVPLACCPSSHIITGTFDAAAIDSTDVVTLVFDWYVYYSVSWVTELGSVNSQAIKVSSTYTLTVKSA